MTWLTNWNRRKQITVNGSTSGTLSDYQMKLTVNQASGTDSAGIVYLGGNVLTTFNDLRFTKSDGTTTLNYWIESITGTTPNQVATIWIKLAPSPDTIPASPGTYNFYIYYNNPSASIGSNGTNTFIQWHGVASANFLDPLVIAPNDIIFEAYSRHTGGSGTNANVGIGSTQSDTPYHGLMLKANSSNALFSNIYYQSTLNGTTTTKYKASTYADGTYLRLKIVRFSSEAHYYVNGVDFVGDYITTNLPTVSLGLTMNIYSGTADQLWSFVRKYASPEPTFSATGTEEYTTIAATGGTVTTSGGYRIHTFAANGTFITNKAMNVEYLVVGGGGAGGFHGGGLAGGGGAGGLRTATGFSVLIQSYNIVVGNGGIATTAYSAGNDGGSSTFGSITSLGGGGGGTYLSGAGRPGGSGGGGGQQAGTYGAGTSGQGKNGGISSNGGIASAGGGGGGAGAVGGNSYDTNTSRGGAGGIGVTSDILGTSSYYAGGGGGATHGSLSGASVGGLGGGGAGYSGGTHIIGVNGTANTGGGGGGGGENYAAGSGGSGIVIIRYLSSYDVTATNMSISTDDSPCRVGLCTATVSVTWANNASSTSISDLSIIVGNGTPTITPSVYSSVSFAANGTSGDIVTKTFTVSNMIVGTHSICPNPN